MSRPSVAVVSPSSYSNLFSSLNSKSSESGHRDCASVDAYIAATEVAEVVANASSLGRAYLNAIARDSSTSVSGTSPSDLDRALNDTNTDSRRRRLGSESDFENLRLGRSTRAGTLDVESVKSAVANGDSSRVSVDKSLVEVVLAVSSELVVSVTLIPVESGLVASSALPGEVDRASIVSELDGSSEGRGSRRESDGQSHSRGLSILAIGKSVGDSEPVASIILS